MRTREIGIRAFLVVSSLVATLVTFELAVRIILRNDTAGYSLSTDRYFGWKEAVVTQVVQVNLPDGPNSFSGTMDHYRYLPRREWGTAYPGNPRGYFEPGNRMTIVTNNEGFRDDDFNREKAPGTFRVAMFGDSFTLGEGVRRGDIFPDRVERLLTAAGRPTEVMNFGVNGYDAAYSLVLMEQTVPVFRPDLVLFNCLVNDIQIYAFQKLAGELAGTERKWSAWLHSPSRGVSFIARRAMSLYRDRRTMAVYRALYGPGKEWDLLRVVFLRMRALAAENGARFMVALLPDLSGWSGGRYRLRWLHDQLGGFLASAGIDLVDLAGDFAGIDVSTLLVHPCDPHPNELAHRIIADRLAVALK